MSEKSKECPACGDTFGKNDVHKLMLFDLDPFWKVFNGRNRTFVCEKVVALFKSMCWQFDQNTAPEGWQPLPDKGGEDQSK